MNHKQNDVISRQTADKWISKGWATLEGVMHEMDGKAYGILTVHANDRHPGYTAHYRDPQNDR